MLTVPALVSAPRKTTPVSVALDPEFYVKYQMRSRNVIAALLCAQGQRWRRIDAPRLVAVAVFAGSARARRDLLRGMGATEVPTEPRRALPTRYATRLDAHTEAGTKVIFEPSKTRPKFIVVAFKSYIIRIDCVYIYMFC